MPCPLAPVGVEPYFRIPYYPKDSLPLRGNDSSRRKSILRGMLWSGPDSLGKVAQILALKNSCHDLVQGVHVLDRELGIRDIDVELAFDIDAQFS